MRKWMMILLAVLLLTGCGKGDQEEVPEEFSLKDISMTLPDGVWRKTLYETQDHFILNDNVIGGIAVMEMENETMEALRHSFDYSDTIVTYIKENILPGYDPLRFDGYMLGSSAYGYFEAELITLDGETKHYLLEGENAWFDVWFDTASVNFRTQAKVVESIRSDALKIEGQMEFAGEAK